MEVSRECKKCGSWRTTERYANGKIKPCKPCTRKLPSQTKAKVIRQAEARNKLYKDLKAQVEPGWANHK